MDPIKAYTNVTDDDWVIAEPHGDDPSQCPALPYCVDHAEWLLSTNLVDNRGRGDNGNVNLSPVVKPTLANNLRRLVGLGKAALSRLLKAP